MQKQQISRRNKICILSGFNLLLSSVFVLDIYQNSFPRGLDFPQKLEYVINISKIWGAYSPDK